MLVTTLSGRIYIAFRSWPLPSIQAKRDTSEVIILIHLDDNLTVWSQKFLEGEEQMLKRLISKYRKCLEELPTPFSVAELSPRWNGAIRMTQSKMIANFATPTTEDGFGSQWALALNNEMICTTDICCTVQLIVRTRKKFVSAPFISLRTAVRHLKNTNEISPDSLTVDIVSIRVAASPDTSFANTAGMKSKLGSAILLADWHGSTNTAY